MSSALPPTGYASRPVQHVPDPRSERRTRLAERGVTLGLALLALGALVVAFIWPVAHIDGGRTNCLMLLTTGLPCPGCGLTRSWVHLAHGDVSGAFAFNHVGPILFAVAVAFVGYVIYAIVRRRPPEAIFTRLAAKPVLVAVGLWFGYSIVRIISIAMGQDTFAAVL